jgi:hypothetical protein
MSTQAIVASWLATLQDLEPMMQASSWLHFPVVYSMVAKAMALSGLCIVFWATSDYHGAAFSLGP